MSLRGDYPYLFDRVRLKAVINTLFGIALVFMTPNYLPSQNATVLQQIGLHIWGAIFLLLGIFLSIGLFLSKDNYKWARMALAASFSYSMVWMIALLLLLFSGHFTTTTTAILWGYWTYNQYHILSDPAWRITSMMQKMKGRTDGQ